ncbi:hypothetical protein OS493_007143 [Desmophyllum pertusum]|uniref:Uncharacterized protein n=1 Tax=Desmophyllum pertusum TaxID=174260 RepID=A0A9W9ZG05_9CNID|nr:hypothetical protein OS493_007143 [Desmophyllum pertusum]
MTDLLTHYQDMYLETLPIEFHRIIPERVQQQLQELRVYSQSYHQELHTIENCVLVDEFEQNLHSLYDYSSALTYEQQCSPAYGNYLKEFLVPSPGDWPSWYYVKKLLVN